MKFLLLLLPLLFIPRQNYELKLTRSVTSDVPAATLFRHLSMPSRWPEFMTDVTSASPLEVIHLGSIITIELKKKPLRAQKTEQIQITCYEPTRICMHVTSTTLKDLTWVISLEKGQIHITSTAQTQSLRMRILGTLAERIIMHQVTPLNIFQLAKMHQAFQMETQKKNLY